MANYNETNITILHTTVQLSISPATLIPNFPYVPALRALNTYPLAVSRYLAYLDVQYYGCIDSSEAVMLTCGKLPLTLSLPSRACAYFWKIERASFLKM